MDLRRTDIKQQNKNVNRLTFVFKHVNKYHRVPKSRDLKIFCFNKNNNNTEQIICVVTLQ